MDAEWLSDLDLLLWVRTGTAFVRPADGPTRRVPAGSGIWLPRGTGGPISTEPGTVSFPYRVPPEASDQAPRNPLAFTVPAEWQDWLILHFLHGSTGHGIYGYEAAGLGDVLTNGPGITDRTPSRPGEEPPLPRASAARRVARDLRESPAIDHSLARWARLTASSVSTIRRGFLDIGWTFERWRTATRLAASCQLLASGLAVETTAMRVGFSSRHGFTRAFGSLYGMTPSDYAARISIHSPGSLLRTEAAIGTAALATVIERLTETAAASAPGRFPSPVPDTRTAWHHNDVHVLIWVYRGSGDLNLGAAHHLRREGDAIWIPAGVDHQAGNHAGSITLPICCLWPEEAHISEPLQVRFSPEWTDFLLHRAVATRTELRPVGFEAREVLDLFNDQLAVDRSQSVPMPTDPTASATARRFLTRMRLPPDQTVTPETHRAFRSETGFSLLQWQHRARMEVARELLDSGARPADVARRVGYLRVRSFSRAFRSRFGQSPREYRAQRE